MHAPAALKRKGKGDDITEDDMDGFISAHNSEFPCLAQPRWPSIDGIRAQSLLHVVGCMPLTTAQ